jgi:hypothetical protein
MMIVLFILQSCKCSEKTVQPQPQLQPQKMEKTELSGIDALPPVIVYKTSKDYSRNVPVMMNEDKTQIVSYPHPNDIYFNGSLAYPTPLEKGYLLDNRGIGLNVAFLDFTYEQYAAFKDVPERSMLLGHIIDKNPLSELWNCGTQSQEKDEPAELNSLIEKGFPGCKQLVKIYKVTLP